MKFFDPGIVLPLKSSGFVPCFRRNVIKVHGLIGIQSQLHAPTRPPFRRFFIGLQFSKGIDMGGLSDDMVITLKQFDVIGTRV